MEQPIHLPSTLLAARILLADDNADLRDHLSHLLQTRYEVEVVNNGKAALYAAHLRPPDLILADILLPALDGFGLLRELRTNPRTRAIPVILLSARKGEEFTVEALEAGANDYLLKPFSAREVMARVASHLEVARIRREANERASELEAVFEAMTDGIDIVDADGAIRQMNQAGYALVGLSDLKTAQAYFTGTPEARSQMLMMRDEQGQPISPERAPAARIVRGEILAGPTTMDVLVRTLDGREREWEFSGAPTRDEGGIINGGVVMFHDVTERRALERRTAESLAARASALASTETTRRMDEFMGLASHELRTPMTSLLVNLQLAERAAAQWQNEALPEPLREKVDRYQSALARSRRQVLRLNRLVGDLLDVSRISAGKLEMRLEPCELGAILRDALDAHQAAWPGRQITLEGGDLLPIELIADADRLGQILSNYLTNALKYSAPEQPIEVTLYREQDVIRIAVRDYGPGIAKEQQVHLFERFYRVPGIAQLSGSGVGLGLGLYISKTIIERHGGQVGVESAPGRGSTFWFTLSLPGASQ